MTMTNTQQPKRIGVVITTYNQPKWLKKVLFGYESQTITNFTVMIADDGSGQPTRDVIEFFQARGKLNLQHIWHEDNGFQKCQILNKTIAQTDCDYLIFTDGDCIPEPRFMEIHRELAKPGIFLSGGYIKLTTPVSEAITEEDISHNRIFNVAWIKSHGQPASHKLWKLVKSPFMKSLLNLITPANTSWNGMNSSTWTSDIRACNGFNEDMQYGGLDRELGERLINLGLKGKQVRYSVNCLHLDHPRAYDNPETWKKNYAIRNEVKRTGRYWTPNGIIKSPTPVTTIETTSPTVR
jgi:glycosyltransferase involved in cell wall biosynthesis